ncbi:MAG: hypothetical protein Ct9H300mP4_05530 [Gammaproteobacteria bacterium]|nr:MAG: hypothetical protein Ct9H300mP4_05530 [Gammaproteobacteria bacterium]
MVAIASLSVFLVQLLFPNLDKKLQADQIREVIVIAYGWRLPLFLDQSIVRSFNFCTRINEKTSDED